MQLTTKETELLKDLSTSEKLCTDKYTKHAAAAKDPQLRDLFSRIASEEQHHLDMINDIKAGNVPTISSGSKSQPTFSQTYTGETENKTNDCYLCNDLLTMEKHASHLYDTCVFEFAQQPLRDVLNHIQTEEQGHGKAIYDYMSTNSMYS